MKFIKLVVVSALAVGSLGVALAQQPPAGGGGGGGRGAAIRAACGADIETNCAGKQGPEIRQCLNDNKAKLSAGCSTALAAAPGGGGGAAP
jgi:hypothetical protein